MHRDTTGMNAAATARTPRPILVYGAALATVLLCACTSGSNWKSSSALSGTRTTKTGPVSAEADRGVSNVRRTTSEAAGPSGTDGATVAARTDADRASTVPAAAPPAAPAGTAAAPAQQTGAARGADSSTAMVRYGEDDGFSDAGSDSADANDAEPFEAGSLAAGAASEGSVGRAGDAAQGAAGDSRAGSTASASDSATAAAAGSRQLQGDGQDAMGALGESTAGERAQPDAAAGAAGAPTGAELADAPGAAGAPAEAATTGTGSDSQRAAAEAGAATGQSSAANGAGSAGDQLSGATGASGATGEQSGTQPAGEQAMQQPELLAGVVEAPGRQATRREEVIAQTLGGLLPLTLGIDGQGEFDFDKAVLRDDVRGQLDVVAERLQAAEYDRLEIVGHTDRIGAEDYNQYLSERRAWAVARYLVEHGVPATKIRVEGRGRHEPMIPLEACGDNLTREQLIACLQKDRRVVISASIRKVDVKVQ